MTAIRITRARVGNQRYRDRSGSVLGDAVLHPLALVGVGLLLANDHVLKAAMPGLLTGKLSDLAGLTFFPLLLLSAEELISRRLANGLLVIGTVVVTGIGFTAVQVMPLAGDWYRVVLGLLQWPVHHVFAALSGGETPAIRQVLLSQDPTDLFTLPALLLPLAIGLRRAGDR